MATFRFASKTLFLFQTSLVLSAAVIYDGGAPNGVDASRLSDNAAAPGTSQSLGSDSTVQLINNGT